ncbi:MULTISPECIES: MauE/DoxX family redox-associated membrane protein [unclassified Sporosarcina]|uniref:MauE/DoxX family redox-associated membrane protein n=1 Tax=unclassified Sporosarcina TaxID=2647733 RepID=UPI001A91111D|nr:MULTISPECIES: MauE/DoxX family redox-associated membrane protein [unclassified Sporosarcina]MBO0587576.1 hypothetical protein [Sporosarcina sp. E16_8]MBO0602437.1 hypothetical protein [Sporosarcina sp. E16_3]
MISIILTVLFYLGKFSLALVFLFSFVDKILNKEKHLISFKAYRILTERLVYIGFYLVLLFEVLIFCNLLLGRINIFTVVIFSSALLIFSIAVTKNIVLGNTDQSCGCGGILENSVLHWGIVFRNFFLIMVISLLFKLENDNILYIINFWEKLLIFSLSICLLLTIMIKKEIGKIIIKRNNILKYLY